MSTSTHFNPLTQSGWEALIQASIAFSSAGRPSMKPNPVAALFTPPLSSFGALPMAAPGARPDSFDASYVAFRFVNSSPTEMTVVAGTTAHYKIHASNTMAVLSDPNVRSHIKINWQHSGATVERGGIQKPSSEFLRPVTSNPAKRLVNIKGMEHVVSYDQRNIFIHVGGSPKAVCIVRADQNGVEFAVMRQHLDEESLPLIIVIIILLQSKTFGGPM